MSSTFDSAILLARRGVSVCSNGWFDNVFLVDTGFKDVPDVDVQVRDLGVVDC